MSRSIVSQDSQLSTTSQQQKQFSIRGMISHLTPRRRAIIIGLLAGLFTATAVITYAFARNSHPTALGPKHMGQGSVAAAYEPLPVPDDLKQLNVLLLGYGGPGHDGGGLSDVIQLVSVDFEREQIYLISIPRDLWVPMPDGSHAKINKGLTYGAPSSGSLKNSDEAEVTDGGLETSKRMTEIVTGIPVQYAIGVDFVNFKRVVGNLLDGIEVDVPEILDDPWYPVKGLEQELCGYTPEEVAELTATLSGFELEKQFECRYEHIHFDPGPQHMEGEDALAFVRSRHGSAGGDFSRSQRQQALLQGMKQKALSLELYMDVAKSFPDFADHTRTDIDLEAAEYIAPLLFNAKDYPIKSIVLSTENVFMTSQSGAGAFILVPKAGADEWASVHAFVQGEL